MKSVLLVCLITLSFASFGGDGKAYSILDIPSELLKNANVVKRLEEIRFEIISLNKSVKYKKVAITILNEQGDRFAGLYEYYNKMQSVKSIDGTLYSSLGEKLKSLKKSDIIDESAIQDFSLFEDSRIKRHNFNCKNYPYTVEYIVETEYSGSLFIPDWRPRPFQFYAVQNSLIQITTPQYMPVRFKAFNLSQPVKQESQKGAIVYSVALHNLPAMINEQFQPYINEISPTVFFAPNDFKYGDWKGNLSTWLAYGKFQNELNAGRDILPEYVKAEVHAIANNNADVKQKIAALYQYMQKNTRYISVQLGIGGFQPFDATFVAQKKYGDCKALSNYMFSLLKEAGIKSCYTMVGAGRDYDDKFTLPDFPNDYFNHIILAVPLKSDTMWLECTSQTLPAGYLSNFTQDRYVLLTDEKGGHLVKTPRYSYKENVVNRKIEATLDNDGTLDIKSNSVYAAMEQDALGQRLDNYSKYIFKEYLKKHIQLPNYDVNAFEYKKNLSALPSINEHIDLKAINYASLSGKRLFIEPNLLDKSQTRMLTDTSRNFDLVLDDEFGHYDTVEIIIPEGFLSEAVPKDVNLKTKFGNYSSHINIAGNKLQYYRSLERFSGQFSAADYSAFASFINGIYKADRSKVVFVKKDL
ncbi:MAG: DUF3857 domain-containing protein [Ginsengibacter sp.]